MKPSVALVLIESRAEVAQLELFAAEIWREHYPSIIGAAKVEYMLQKFQSTEALMAQIKEGMQLFWINYEGEHAGYAAIKRQENMYLFVSKFYVHKRYRGKGIGKSAMKWLNAQAAEMHLDGLELTVNKNNDSAIAFYEALGFENTFSQKVDIGGGFYMDDYVMRLTR
jgi:ribosomal protein S18 acetylase RimI-like enzyme